MSNKTPIYYYDPIVGNFHYGQMHPMKPQRIQITHSLVLHYGLHKKLHFYQPRLATKTDLTTFHRLVDFVFMPYMLYCVFSKEYIDFLSRVTNENQTQYSRELERFSVGQANGDSPVFGGMYEFCRRYTGGSLTAACHMNQVYKKSIYVFDLLR